MNVAQILLGTHPAQNELSVSKQIIVWLVAVGGVLIGLIAIPGACFFKVASDLAAQEALCVPLALTFPHVLLLGFSLLLAVVLSTVAGGILKMATLNSPIQWSAYALLASLLALAVATYLLGEARVIFATADAKGSAWVMPWLGTIVVLLGWTLKAPWDRCTQVANEATAKFTGWLDKPNAFTKTVTATIAALPVLSMDVVEPIDRLAPLEPDRS